MLVELIIYIISILFLSFLVGLATSEKHNSIWPGVAAVNFAFITGIFVAALWNSEHKETNCYIENNKWYCDYPEEVYGKIDIKNKENFVQCAKQGTLPWICTKLPNGMTLDNPQDFFIERD